jgi:hypothetical protein
MTVVAQKGNKPTKERTFIRIAPPSGKRDRHQSGMLIGFTGILSLANCYFASHRACNIIACLLFMLSILNALLILARHTGQR